MWPATALMVKPIGFKVSYAINPYMTDQSGNLNLVDEPLAFRQWESLKNKFTELGVAVDVLDGTAACPDMVFCANQTLPFVKDGQKSILLSRMHSEFRQPEVPFFRKWADDRGYKTYEITNYRFEGCGDAIYNYESGQIYVGYGFRTDPRVFEQVAQIVNKDLIPLELASADFYHLDTCFMVLNKNTAAYVPQAFSEDSVRRLKQNFKDLLPIDFTEAKTAFAGNALCINGHDVILHKGAPKLCEDLTQRGFRVHEVDVSEFLKSGGAVFCMKQMLF